MRLSPLACAVIAAALALPAAAESDKGHGKGGGGGPPPHAQGGGAPAGAPAGRGGSEPAYVVVDRDRDAIYSYYRGEHARGNCPPGLAKKDNGCLPPGQAKKMWAVGQPLPAGVYYEPLPPLLLGRLSPAPAGYQYVRVASDVLMLAVGTRMVMASLADLSSF